MSISSIPGSQAESQEWIELPLLNLIEPLKSGSRPKGGVRGIDSGIPSVGGEHLTAEGGFNFAKVKFVPKAFYASMRRGHIRRGDILIVKDGATTGKVALVRDDFPFEEAVVNEHVFIIRPKSDHDSRYIFWYLHSKEGQERVLQHFQGAAQGGINQQFAPGTFVPIPPTRDDEASIATQIEGLVEGLQSPRDRLATIPALLKKFRQSVLAAACSGQLTADWRMGVHNLESGQELLERLLLRETNSLQGRKNRHAMITDTDDLPTEWTRATMAQICGSNRYSIAIGPFESNLKVSDYRDTGTPLVFVRNIRAQTYNDSKTKYIDESKAMELAPHSVEPGDILVTKMGDPPGDVDVYPNGLPKAIMTADCIKMTLWPDLHTRYAMLALRSSDFQEQVAAETIGIAQQKISLERFARMSIPLPSREEQAEIVHRVESLFALADSIESRLAEATAQIERTTQAILAKAFQGDLASGGA